MNIKFLLVIAVVSMFALTACQGPAFSQGDDEQDFTVLPPGEGIDVNVPDVEESTSINESTEGSEEIGTQKEETTENKTAEVEEPESTSEEETTENKTAEVEEPESTSEEKTIDNSKYIKKVVLEGDLVKLSPEAVDPDGDEVTYEFSYPLNEDGEWQTEVGDEGQYLVEITATDGRLQTSQKVLVVVESSNKAPSIKGLDNIEVDEGDTVKLDFEVEDPDGDEVKVTISGWMDTSEYETNYEDAGVHTVKVTATDGKKQSRKTITVTVNDVNRAPVIKPMKDIFAVEEDEIKLQPDVTDLDGDELSISFSEPFDTNGEWQTEVGDEGTYEVAITATDGTETVEETVTVIVRAKNQAPVIIGLEDIEVDEGDTVKLDFEVEDADGDEVEIEISGWMSSTTYETDYEDAGVHDVTVTVTDGKSEISKEITVTVNNVNRPPEFVLVG